MTLSVWPAHRCSGGTECRFRQEILVIINDQLALLVPFFILVCTIFTSHPAIFQIIIKYGISLTNKKMTYKDLK